MKRTCSTKRCERRLIFEAFRVVAGNCNEYRGRVRSDTEAFSKPRSVLAGKLLQHCIKSLQFFLKSYPPFGQQAKRGCQSRNMGVFPSDRTRAQFATHSAIFVLERRSRMSCGALTSRLLS
jgi:hypothetical protein